MTTLAAEIPTLTTERLVLRAPREEDIGALAAFFADAQYSAGFGGPLARPDAWRWHALSVGHWIFRGYGYFSVDLRETGEHVGLAGIWNPEGWPEPELGWVLYRQYQGHGLAAEAALAARTWAYDTLGLPALASNIMPDNTASIRLARRLGARFERSYENVFMGRVELWRHPGPGAAAGAEATAGAGAEAAAGDATAGGATPGRHMPPALQPRETRHEQ